jgi:hypothetical protein
MKRILLGTLAAAAAAALTASGFTITAAAQSDQQPMHAELVQRWAEAGIDTQLKGMKASLRLTADQEKDWGPLESAVKAAEKGRVVALQNEQGNNLSPMDRLNAKAERAAQSEADLEKIVEAVKPLYVSLDDAQKHKFVALGRMLVPERGRFARELRRLSVGAGGDHTARSSNSEASAFDGRRRGRCPSAGLFQSTGEGVEAHATLSDALEGFAPTPVFPLIAGARALLAAMAAGDRRLKVSAAARARNRLPTHARNFFGRNAFD